MEIYVDKLPNSRASCLFSRIVKNEKKNYIDETIQNKIKYQCNLVYDCFSYGEYSKDEECPLAELKKD